MAAKLCCTNPSRSSSPQELPPRPLKTWRSLAAIRQPHLHESQLLLGENGSQPHAMSTADSMELHRIFVAASLPEDHPDALRITNRKPSLDDSIICSPSFTRKIRRQLSRKSLASGKSGMKATRIRRRPSRSQSQHFDSNSSAQELPVPDLFLDGQHLNLSFDADALSLTLNDSHFASLGLDGATEHSDLSKDGRDTQKKHERSERHHSERSHRNRRSVSLPRASRTGDTPALLRRAKSSSTLGEGRTSSLPDIGHWQLNSDLINFDTSWQLPLQEMLSPIPPEPRPLSTVQELPSPSPCRLVNNLVSRADPQQSPLVSQPTHFHAMPSEEQHDVAAPSTERLGRPNSQSSEDSVHLYDMQISQHLRSQSQHTDVSSFNDPKKPWNQHLLGHASLNSVIWSSGDSLFQRKLSSVSRTNAALSPAWGRAMVDASSSIYSRSPSSESSSYPLPYDISHISSAPQDVSMMDLLKPENVFGEKQATKNDEVKDTLSDSEPVALKATDELPASDIGPTLSTSNSSASLGRLSKFQEDVAVSSPTKTTKKRRSVLQFLFPRLVKPKLRSISSPVL